MDESVNVHLTSRFTRAIDYARITHGSDTRKGTDRPYLAHVLAVAAIVLDHGGDEDQAIAALLHDAAEDAGGVARLDHIAAEFGPGVGAIVEACSDSLASDPTKKPDWWTRKVRYVNHLVATDHPALLVVAADKLDNLNALLEDHESLDDPAELWARFRTGRAGTLWYYLAVIDALSARMTEVHSQRIVSALRTRYASLVESVRAREPEVDIDADQDAACRTAAAHDETASDAPSSDTALEPAWPHQRAIDVDRETFDRLVAPFYLKMMGIHRHAAPALIDQVRAAAVTTTTDDVIGLLHDGWRTRVMGAWYSTVHSGADVGEALNEALETSLGRLDAGPLITACIVANGKGAIPSIRRYEAFDRSFNRGARNYAMAALVYFGAIEASDEYADGAHDLRAMLGIAQAIHRSPAIQRPRVVD